MNIELTFVKKIHLHTILLYFLYALVFCLLTGQPLQASDCRDDTSECFKNEEPDEPYLTKEFTLDGPGMLKVSTSIGDIDVVGVEDTDRVKVELYVKRGFRLWSSDNNVDNYYINIEKNDNEIIAVTEPKNHSGNVSHGDHVIFRFKVYVPTHISSKIRVDLGNVMLKNITGNHRVNISMGDLSIQNIQGEAKLYTVGGNIHIGESEGKLMALTKGGGINVTNSKGELRVQSSAGSITARNIGGAFLAKTSAGNIDAHFVYVKDGIRLETKIGNVRAEFKDNTPLNIEVTGGSLELDRRDHFTGEIDGNSAHGIIFGGGTTVNISTQFGSINVDFYEP